MRQADIFRESEGDAWLERNRDRLGQHDPVSDLIKDVGIKPMNVLEVGCANGWRLAKLRNEYGCNVVGVEPSLKAGIEAASFGVPVVQMTAANLAIAGEPFDLVIYGFCLYLTDPEDWFRIASEGDLVLKNGGHLIIHDFFESSRLFARPYEHRSGVFSYHFDFAQLWLTHPWYHLVRREIVNDDEAVVILKKRPRTEVRA